MERIWERALELLARDEPFVLATVIRVRGSTPRGVGTKMIVPAEGQPFGTIGGGCGEAEVARKARLVFRGEGPSRVIAVDMTGDFGQDEVQICGGVMDVALDFWSPRAERELALGLAECARHRAAAALLTFVDPVPWAGVAVGSKARLLLEQGEGRLRPETPLDEESVAAFCASITEGRARLFRLRPRGGAVEDAAAEGESWPAVFVDVLPGIETLLIVGAGHIAVPLCELGALLGFRAVVVDDRRAFANSERFPRADDIRVGSFVEVLEGVEIDERTFVVVVTRGHAWDEASLRTVLKRRPAYVGMIGSARRARATIERLAGQGYAQEALGRVHAPIGLDLGAETPAEIALAIMAEIVRARRAGSLETISMAAKVRPAAGPHPFSP